MKKLIIPIILICILTLSLVCFVACNNETETNYPKMIDNSREYSEQTLTEEQKNITDYCTIAGYYTSGDYKVIRVISSEGFNGDIDMLILLNGTVVEKMIGIDIKETDEYGAKCFKDAFINQFNGKDLKTMEPLKGKEDPMSSGDILYVTHATTTSRALIKAVNATSLFVKTL